MSFGMDPGASAPKGYTQPFPSKMLIGSLSSLPTFLFSRNFKRHFLKSITSPVQLTLSKGFAEVTGENRQAGVCGLLWSCGQKKS